MFRRLRYYNSVRCLKLILLIRLHAPSKQGLRFDAYGIFFIIDGKPCNPAAGSLAAP